MESASLLPAQDGFYQGWYDLRTGTTAWENVDDDPMSEDHAAHDGDASWFRLPLEVAAPSQVGRVSVRINQVGLHSILPATVAVRIVARTVLYSALNPQNTTLQAGFCTYDGITNVGASFQPTASYLVWDTSFTTNPFTGASWQRGELAGLELFIENIFVPVAGNTLHYSRVTQMLLAVTYENGHYGSKRGPGAILR